MTELLPVQCLACTRLDRSQADELSGLPIVKRCQAFTLIPEEIRLGADHRFPVRGERLLFDQVDSDDGRRAFQTWTRVFKDGPIESPGGELGV